MFGYNKGLSKISLKNKFFLIKNGIINSELGSFIVTSSSGSGPRASVYYSNGNLVFSKPDGAWSNTTFETNKSLITREEYCYVVIEVSDCYAQSSDRVTNMWAVCGNDTVTLLTTTFNPLKDLIELNNFLEKPVKLGFNLTGFQEQSISIKNLYLM